MMVYVENKERKKKVELIIDHPENGLNSSRATSTTSNGFLLYFFGAILFEFFLENRTLLEKIDLCYIQPLQG
jgi:hypothetical protein